MDSNKVLKYTTEGVIKMSKCDLCDEEMLTADGCLERIYLLNDKSKVEPVKVGEEDDNWVDPGERCGDCGSKYGEYHHIGCDVERCGMCDGQFISCDCDYSNEMLIEKNHSSDKN